MDLIVTVPAFLDLTLVALEGLPKPGEERFAGDLLRSPGGGAITAVAAARLGLRTALVAPLGDDMLGEWVRGELESEGITVAGRTGGRMAQTIVMPCGDDRAMVTIDPGARARRSDVEAQLPAAGIACTLDQLHLVPEDVRMFVTCGGDDARAYAGRLPAASGRASVLVVDHVDACVLTGADDVEDAARALGASVPSVIVTRAARPAVAVLDGEVRAPADLGIGPVVDTTGDVDLLCGAFAWAELRGATASVAADWALLYAALAGTVPTGTGGAVSEASLLEAGLRRGLEPPPQVAAR